MSLALGDSEGRDWYWEDSTGMRLALGKRCRGEVWAGKTVQGYKVQDSKSCTDGPELCQGVPSGL